MGSHEGVEEWLKSRPPCRRSSFQTGDEAGRTCKLVFDRVVRNKIAFSNVPPFFYDAKQAVTWKKMINIR